MKTSAKILILVCVVLWSAGCIRLTGGAGVWKQGSEDEEPVSHQASFDTANLIPSSSKNS